MISSSILRGQLVDDASAQSTVAIVVPNQLCSGALIAPNLVLTAAHCLHAHDDAGDVSHVLDADEVTVIAGVSALFHANEAHRYQASKLVVHPAYARAPALADFDLGLILLQRPTPLPALPVVPAEEISSVLAAGNSVTIAGYGADDPEGMLHAGHLRTATVSVEPRTSRYFVAGMLGEPDSCTGDSGGAAIMELDGELMLLGVLANGIIGDDRSISCGYGGEYAIAARELPRLTDLLDTDDTSPAQALESSGDETHPRRAAQCNLDPRARPAALSLLVGTIALAFIARRSSIGRVHSATRPDLRS